MKNLSRSFLSSLLFISSFALAAPSSPNANVEKQIDAKQQRQQAEQDAAILAQNAIRECAFRGGKRSLSWLSTE